MLLILAVVAIVVGVLVFTAASRSPRTRNVGRRVRRSALGAFFVSVAVNAAFGIYAVLTPHFGDTAGTVLGTSLCVTGAILVALFCEPAWERGLLTPVPVVGALLGAAAFAGLIVGLWTEPDSATLGKLLASTFAAAIGCALASVVVLERERMGISLRHRRAITATLGVIALDVALAVLIIWFGGGPHGAGKLAMTGLVATGACILADLLTLFRPAPPTRRVLTLTLGLIGLAAAVAVALVWAGASGDTAGNFAGTCGVAAVACALAAFLTHARLGPEHRWVLTATLALLALGAVLVVADIWLAAWGLTRAMGVVLIVLAAFAVTVPVLHRLDRGAIEAAAAAGSAILYCPYCGRKLSGEAGVEARCARCGRGFTVIDSERSGADAPAAPGRRSAGRPADRSRRSRERKFVSDDVRAR